MTIADLTYLFIWWGVIFLLTLAVLPGVSLIFASFYDRGYIFAKIVGILLLAYIVFVFGVLHIAPFTFATIFSLLLFFILVNIAVALKFSASFSAPQLKFALLEEFLFLSLLYIWSYVRAHQPAIEGLEKFMDYGFVKSILNSTYFPPHDMWLSPAPINAALKPQLAHMLQGFYINYYYFGHLVAAVLTRLSQLPAAVTYNLQLATIAALTFTGSFSLGINLFKTTTNKSAAKNTTNNSRQTLPKRVLFAGLLTGFLVTFAGNLHTIYSFTPGYTTQDNQLPPPPWRLSFDIHLSDYWYPNATRFIPYTIHEFPSYSFIVSDLHGHVSNIPFVLLILAVLLNLLQRNAKKGINKGKRRQHAGLLDILKNLPKPNLLTANSLLLILIGFLLAVFYMTNSWDTLVYGLFTVAILATICNLRFAIFRFKFYTKLAQSLLVVGLSFYLFSFPFSHFFHPFSSKIGVNCGYATLNLLRLKRLFGAEGKQTIELGPFLFEANKCQRTPLWMHAVLWGFFYYIILGFILFILLPKLSSGKKFPISNFQPPLSPTLFFLSLLILLSIALLWLPEFAYIKDIYPAHFRANTMFKLGYQAFIMLSLVAGYTITTIFNLKKKKLSKKLSSKIKIIYIFFLLPQLFLVGIYPLFGVNSYYNGLRNYQGLYGLNWLRKRYPDDYNAIVWLDAQTKSLCSRFTAKPTCPVILEAVGDSYTQYARVSANTGLPTVLGWPVHEWLWRGSYDEAGQRRADVETIYTSSDIAQVKNLLKKYNVQYIIVGALEREKYPNLNEKILQDLGTIVYQSKNTKIYTIKELMSPVTGGTAPALHITPRYRRQQLKLSNLNQIANN